MPLLIGIIVVIVIAVVAVIIAGNKKPSAPATTKSQTSISTTANTTAQNTTKESTTESTTQTNTTTTGTSKLGEIKNIKTDCYSIYDEYTGFSGVVISFDSVTNADGYRLEYVFDDGYGNEKSGFQDIDKNQVQLYFAGQDLPAIVKATAFSDKDGMTFGETVVLYDGYHSHFDTDLSPEEWNNLTRGITELRPFDYYEY